MNYRHAGVTLMATVAVGVWGASACQGILGIEDGTLRATADGSAGCIHNSDCSKGHVCIFQTCSLECVQDVDCPKDYRCLKTLAVTACVSANQAACSGQDCPKGTTCNDGSCRTRCGTSSAGCRTDQVCTSNVCVGTSAGHEPTLGSGGSSSGGASSGGGGGAANSGGALNTGGVGAGGTTGTGGSIDTGGVPNSGGATNSGGVPSSGGVTNSGGVPNSGGVTNSGGVPNSGGVTNSGGTAGTGGTAGAGGGGPATRCLKPGSGDYSKAGPYAVTTKNVDLAGTASLPSSPTTFQIFRPQTLETSCPHPVVAWGNGTGVTGSTAYAFFQNNAASWGIIVIASENGSVGSGAFHTAALDYMLGQNVNPTSEFYGKLSTRFGTSGHSQGAIGATAATTHPNVEAEVQIEGSGNPKAGTALLALAGSADTTIPISLPTNSYNAATGPAMLAEYEGADHSTTPTLAGWNQQNPGTIQFVRLYTAWFRCFLADDQTACAMFEGGASCGICADPNWTTMSSKNM